jgi:Peptidase family C54
VESILGNGLDPPQLRDAYSLYLRYVLALKILTHGRALANQHAKINFAVHVTGDGSDVYEDGVFKTAKAKTGSFQPTLILVGTRLGLKGITPVYWEALKAALRIPQSVGIAG